MKLDFTKLQGSGNDFILFDFIDEKTPLSAEDPVFIKKVCRRKTGIGSDGVLILESSDLHDFRMRIFNPDGSEVSMCGNGARCCALYYCRKKSLEHTKFETGAGIMKASLNGKRGIRLSLPSPYGARLDFPVKLGNKKLNLSFVNSGVEHTIVEVESTDETDVTGLGRKIRFHDEFAPLGTNVDFVEKTGPNSINVRTYERGVEDETLACGTGVVASAVIEGLKGKVQSPVDVKTRGGEVMKVFFSISEEGGNDLRFSDIELQGEVESVFRGIVDV